MELSCHNVTITIADKTVCEKLNFHVEAGQFWGILGENGVGKTTLLHTLMRLFLPDTGTIFLNQRPLSEYQRTELARVMGLMLQEYEYNFPCTVIEAAMIGRHPHLHNWQWESQEDKQIALEALARANLKTLQGRQINTLSGGEKRRLNLATLITQNPDFFLLDEPTNHLDLKSQVDILQLLQNQFRKENKSGIMVIHDPNLALRFCDHILLLLGQGRWLAGKTREIINNHNLSQVFHCDISEITNGTTSVFIPS